MSSWCRRTRAQAVEVALVLTTGATTRATEAWLNDYAAPLARPAWETEYEH